jgi:hypothetical protein
VATFIWPPEVQWPPPAHILLNYDVVAPGGVALSSLHDRRGDLEEETKMTQPYLALITPLSGGHPDQGLPPTSPGVPTHPIYHPGHPDHGLPAYPDQGLPGGSQGGRPSHPIYHPGHPDHGLPPYPDQGLPGGGSSGGQPSHPIHIPGVPDQGLPPGEEIPSNELPPIPVPPEYQDDLVIGVKQAGSTEWTFTAYDVQPDQGQPSPTPHRRR